MSLSREPWEVLVSNIVLINFNQAIEHIDVVYVGGDGSDEFQFCLQSGNE